MPAVAHVTRHDNFRVSLPLVSSDSVTGEEKSHVARPLFSFFPPPHKRKKRSGYTRLGEKLRITIFKPINYNQQVLLSLPCVEIKPVIINSLQQGRRYQYSQYGHGSTTFPAGFLFSLTLIYDY